MKILVTGAGGFLGSHLVKKLIKEGHEVIGLARKSHLELENLGVKFYQVDLSSNKNNVLKEALEGVETIFHTAAKVSMWGDYQDFYQTNYEGTKKLVELAKIAGARYFIYTSTPSVVFQDKSLEGIDETHPYAFDSYSMYAKSKILAEKFVLNSGNENFHVLALRPHLIYGEGDKNIIPRLIARARRGKLKIIGNGKNKVDVLHIDNAVHAHLTALNALIKNPLARNQAYFIGNGEPVVLWDFIFEILKKFDLKIPRKKIPFWVAFTLGSFFESLYGLLRIAGLKTEPPMTRFIALQLAYSHYFSHEKAKQFLEYAPIISTKESLEKMSLN